MTMGRNPAPKRENIGPGQAPEMAHPQPKIIPPNKYRFQPFSFLGKVIGALSKKDLSFNFLMIKIMMVPKNKAEPMTPYI